MSRAFTVGGGGDPGLLGIAMQICGNIRAFSKCSSEMATNFVQESQKPHHAKELWVSQAMYAGLAELACMFTPVPVTSGFHYMGIKIVHDPLLDVAEIDFQVIDG